MSARFSATALVVPFENLRMTDVEAVGGKNASLGEMISQLPHGVRVPTGFATTAHAFREFLKHGGLATMNHHEWTILLIGFVISFLVAWGVVAWFMHWVRRHGFVPFAVYRILAGIAVLVWLARFY